MKKRAAIDTLTLTTAMAIMESMPDNAANSAASAAASAEAAAESAQTAQEHSTGFSYADGVLTLTPMTGGNE